MLRTITLGTGVTVQGLFVKRLPTGRVVVRVGRTLFTGRPVVPGAPGRRVVKPA